MGDDRVRVDAYIKKAAPFARPILEKVRSAFHKGCPDIEEKIKWGCPSFEKHGMVGGMAAFKAHATFGFWRGEHLADPHGILKAKGTASFMAEKLTDVSQLPPEKILADYVKRAVALNLSGDLPKRAKKPPRPPVKAPPYFMAALRKNAKALAAYEAFPPSHKREYVEWITEAKQEATRDRRVATAIKWLSKGKSKNWKYENC